MAAPLESCLDNREAKLHEWANDIDDDLPALEQVRQSPLLMGHPDAFVIVSVQLRHLSHLRRHPFPVPTGGDEGDATLGELPSGKLARVPARSIEYDLVF